MAQGDEPVRAHDLSALRVLASTGEPWNEAPWRWYFDVVGGGRCPVINISGGTEVGACFLSPHVVQPLSPCSLGGPALGMAVDVFDDGGRPVRGEVGELVCTKPWPGMTRGLWKDPERYLETYWSRWPDVWWHGDFASVSPDGQWFLHGRSDDTIKLAGKRLGPAEVETVVVAHPSVLEAAAVGIPRRREGRGAVGLRGAGSRRECRRRVACGGARPRRAPPRSVVPALRGAVHDRVAEDAQREGSQARDPLDRDGRAGRRSLGSGGPLYARRRAEGELIVHELIGARVLLRPLTSDDWEAWREVRLRCPRVARTVGAETRARQRGPGARPRGLPRALRRLGSASVTSTRRTGSGCSSPTAGSRAR
ncbi:MAG: hypothetical protein KatS3mg010_0179 [Acidimicrobiia bacterium]|nr:MAG: hypothetical protein KatS3mg010_0179 [Acidimicrobiia bacterium]